MRNKRKTAKNKLDKVFTEYIHKRDSRCCTCGATEGLQASHFYSRRFLATRWMEENVHLQCYRCHWAHERHYSTEYHRFMTLRYGQDMIDDLEFQRRRLKGDYTATALQGMIKHYQEKIRGLE